MWVLGTMAGRAVGAVVVAAAAAVVTAVAVAIASYAVGRSHKLWLKEL